MFVQIISGTTIDGHAISVAISNPPAKKIEPSASARSDVRSLGGGAKDVGARGRGRTQVSFVPRALAVKPTTAAAANGSGKSKPENSGESLAGKSNQDFRNMLLGKKWCRKILKSSVNHELRSEMTNQIQYKICESGKVSSYEDQRATMKLFRPH